LIAEVLIACSFLLTPPVPGSICTPDDPDFFEYRYPQKIAYCKRNVSHEKRVEICERDGVFDRSEYTVDHIIPLSIGGSNDDDNLWCQHRSLAVTRLEYQLYLKIKNGEINQDSAIERILRAKF